MVGSRSSGERQTAASGRASDWRSEVMPLGVITSKWCALGWRRGGDKRPCGRRGGRTTSRDRVASDQTAHDEQRWESKRLTGSEDWPPRECNRERVARARRVRKCRRTGGRAHGWRVERTTGEERLANEECGPSSGCSRERGARDRRAGIWRRMRERQGACRQTVEKYHPCTVLN